MVERKMAGISKTSPEELVSQGRSIRVAEFWASRSGEIDLPGLRDPES
jgi:hypothetical protein